MPIFRHFDLKKKTRLKTDASNGVMAEVLAQKTGENWFSVGYWSKTFEQAKLNYKMPNKKLMAVVRAMQHWKAKLIGLHAFFLAITNHKALKYFSLKRLFNQRQANWVDTLAQYHFEITYRPNKKNVLTNVLSKKAEDFKDQKSRRKNARTMQVFRMLKDLL